MSRLEFVGEAEKIAREAGALLRGFYEKGVATEYKGDVDLVTEADRASEQLIVSRLKAAFPGHGIYGEEGTREGLEAEYRWYVDPLDGTTNFAHGFPAFCVLLGLEHRALGLAADADGEMVAAVTYDPLRNEMFEAEKIAREAGALLRGFYEKGVATEYKGDVDLVTEADRASEKLIVSRLKAAFPGHGIFGEEGTRDGLESEYRW